MKKLFLVLAVLMAVSMTAGTAMAISFGDGGASLQGILDNITTAPVAGDSSVDVPNDYMIDSLDSYWNVTGTGISGTTMIIELAGYAGTNTFGVYNSGQYVELFAGSNVAGDQVTLSIKLDGSVYVDNVDKGVDFTNYMFGYYLDSSAGADGGLWHSDTSLNTDSMDHMAAYQGTNTDWVQIADIAPGLWSNNEYILAFEDLAYTGEPEDYKYPGDGDYNDMVLMVESVRPIPEPATLFLLGSGLVGLAGIGRKKIKRS